MIEFRNLTKRYGSFLALDDVSLDIHEGESFALLGPNGSGKTTLLKCLMGLSVPTAGSIRVNGVAHNHSTREIRREMSFLPQRLSFHENLTAREVLEFYSALRKLPEGRIDEVLSNKHFDFNGFCHKPVGDLSGGMVQRLGLAVACLPDAPILVLDEPTVSLDPQGAINFRSFLKILKSEGKTIVFSSHVLADVEQLADRVGILVGGQLVAIESTAQLQDDLSRSCRMRVVVDRPAPVYCEAARRAGASEATVVGEYLVVISREADRLNVLRAIGDAGARIERFATEGLSLESVYLRLIERKESKDAN